ncbi:MAG: metallophosphoesterase, partial [Thermodesulfobacteriota bacterium]
KSVPLWLPALLAVLLWAGFAFAWSFAVTGDSHDDGEETFRAILQAVDRSDMEFLIHTGDLVPRDGEREWRRLREATAPFGKPIHPAAGNRDGSGPEARKRFAKRFGLPGTEYSFTRRDARFVVLDNSGGSLSDRSLAWLDRELASRPKGADGIAFLIVVMHIPPAAGTLIPHGTRPGYDEQCGKLLAILQKHGVDAVLSGHEHMNHTEDWDGILLVVSSAARVPWLPLQRRGFFRIVLEDGRIREVFLQVDPRK